MGIEEIYKFLKENEGFHSVREISEGVSVGLRSVSNSMKTLVRYDDIMCEYRHLTRTKKKKRVGLRTRKSWVYSYIKNKKEMI